MAYAILLKKKNTSGALAVDWFRSFMTGDTQARRDSIVNLPPDPVNWEIVEVPDPDTYRSTENLVYGAERAASAAAEVQAQADWDSAKTKLRLAWSQNLNPGELQQATRRLLGS